MALIAIAQGVRLVQVHGRSGNAFLLALAGGMGLRLLLGAIGVGASVALQGEAAALSFIGGAMAGYVPLQIFEGIWFARLGAAAAASTRQPIDQARRTA